MKCSLCSSMAWHNGGQWIMEWMDWWKAGTGHTDCQTQTNRPCPKWPMPGWLLCYPHHQRFSVCAANNRRPMPVLVWLLHCWVGCPEEICKISPGGKWGMSIGLRKYKPSFVFHYFRPTDAHWQRGSGFWRNSHQSCTTAKCFATGAKSKSLFREPVPLQTIRWGN